MSNFFNGADASEVAGLNLSNSGLNIIVKQYLGNEEAINKMTAILNSDKAEFDKEVELVSTAMEECPAMQDYSMHEVRATLSRRINTNSRTVAENHGFKNYLRFSKGKVKKAELLLEQKPAV
jgi:hypothetical protein